MKNLCIALSAGLLFASCSSTNLMSLSVVQPAPVTLPNYAKTVAVVNRTRATNETRTVDALHKAMSLESSNLQKEGARASMTGLADELMKNNRFSMVKPLTNLDLRSFGAGVFPSAMSWDTVEKICRDNNTDLLFSLELFDAETKAAVGQTALGTMVGGVPALAQQVNMTTLVKTGWRIYDPSSRNILDEYVLSRDLAFRGSPMAAASAIIGHKEEVVKVGNQAGQAYAYRIMPYSVRVSRFYYVRGSSNFTVATRMARTGNWDGAAKLWQQETTNASRKVAGRACYNMAIISEINGDLNGAMAWAQKAYENYNNRLALSYVNVLRNRQSNDAVLKEQTEVSSNP
ncbi:MAG: hypothetical protein BGO55_09775 [Sphingobacteriales bacterium 50-39]|nr:hypothetical protein [Sphingobacteriales bacterium]OJW57830.1 MAG: hypothetical protein BGO55_09775 [Sphingobacteriales bacterium 50-39]